MNRLTSTKSLAAVALALGALVAASSAQARSDVYFSIGVQSPGYYVESAPVYVRPAPVYVQPRPIYMPAPGYYGHHDDGRRYQAQQWQRRGPYGDRVHDGIANVYDSGGRRNQWRQPHAYGPYGDLDGDGIRNQNDRDVDGDGVRNRFDRDPVNPSRR